MSTSSGDTDENMGCGTKDNEAMGPPVSGSISWKSIGLGEPLLDRGAGSGEAAVRSLDGSGEPGRRLTVGRSGTADDPSALEATENMGWGDRGR